MCCNIFKCEVLTLYSRKTLKIKTEHQNSRFIYIINNFMSSYDKKMSKTAY